MADKSYDILLYGATGFTGQRAAKYLADNAPADLRLAIGGRNKEKLERVQSGLSRKVDVLVADAKNKDAVFDMISKTRVVATTAGPYALYGDHIVDACVEHLTHYADITGESPWVRDLIDRHHEQAAKDGTRIIPLCGFDSVPSDIGVLFAVNLIREKMGQGTKLVKGFFKMKGGYNGGTFATAINMFESGEGKRMFDPVLLSPKEWRTKEARSANPDQRGTAFDEDIGKWTSPFVMAPVNTRVVRRSQALMHEFGHPYGKDFCYRESFLAGGRLASTTFTAGLGLATSMNTTSVGRSLMRRFGPSPGEGPSEEAIEGGFFKTRFVAQSDDGTKVRIVVSFPGDAGNKATITMLAECALALALDDLPGGAERGGLLTPASGIGAGLIDRLRKAGMTIAEEDG